MRNYNVLDYFLNLSVHMCFIKLATVVFKKKSFYLNDFYIDVFMIDGYFNGIDWVNYYYGFITYTDVMDYLSSYEPLFGSEIFILKYLFTDFYLSIAMYYFILSVLLYFAIIKLRGCLTLIYACSSSC